MARMGEMEVREPSGLGIGGDDEDYANAAKSPVPENLPLPMHTGP